jgi:hypothetical protein
MAHRIIIDIGIIQFIRSQTKNEIRSFRSLNIPFREYMGNNISQCNDDGSILEGYMEVSKNKKWLIVTPLMRANSPSDVILVAIHSVETIAIKYSPEVDCFTLFINHQRTDMRSVLLGREAANEIVEAITGDVIKIHGVEYMNPL